MINLEMANKLNIKAMYTPEYKKLVETAKKKAAFERNLDIKGNCWKHGYRVIKLHISKTCNDKVAAHQRQAKRQNIMVGSEDGKLHMGMGIKIVN